MFTYNPEEKHAALIFNACVLGETGYVSVLIFHVIIKLHERSRCVKLQTECLSHTPAPHSTDVRCSVIGGLSAI